MVSCLKGRIIPFIWVEELAAPVLFIWIIPLGVGKEQGSLFGMHSSGSKALCFSMPFFFPMSSLWPFDCTI